MSLQSFVGEFLTFLEKREERLLSWGFYNVRWTAADIETAFANEAPEGLQLAWEEFENGGRTISTLLLQMRQRNLIYAVPGSANAYRTRFAEGVRLLSSLRQMFRENDWATGPRLVSDIKLDIQPRQYPRRDLSADSVWARLQPHCPSQQLDLIRQCFFALAARDGSSIKFSGFQVRAFEHILQRYGSAGLSGSVVCAGTGSGKTKAFYVPAFLSIVPTLSRAPYTKIIAIYPRNVLLADQLREAISTSRSGHSLLSIVRPLRVIHSALANWRGRNEIFATARDCAAAIRADMHEDKLLRREFANRIKRLNVVPPILILDALAQDMPVPAISSYDDEVIKSAGIITAFSNFFESPQGRAYSEVRLALHAALDFQRRFNIHAPAPPQRYNGIWRDTIHQLVVRLEDTKRSFIPT